MIGDRPTAVSFDCWSTLLYERDRMASWERRVEIVARTSAGLGLGDAWAARRALDAAWHRHQAMWQAGLASGAAEIAEWTLAALSADRATQAPAAEVAEELAEALATVPLSGGVHALEGARESLERLAARGIRRALVCDTGLSPGAVVRELLASTGLLELLEVTIFSDEVGAPKPDHRPFAAALAALELSQTPASVVHVGDLRRTDVAGARAAGMATVRIRDHHDDVSDLPEADAVADSHAHLLEILGLER